MSEKKNKKCTPGLLLGQQLNIAAAALANAVAEGHTVDELEVLSSFAQLVSQALSNIAVTQASCEKDQEIFIEE